MHRSENEARLQRRSLTRVELQALFDAADDLVDQIRARGRKGWVAAFRDATMIKTAYAFGLRRHELVRLDVHDFGRNPKADEFGEFGVCHVRFGKAMAGSPPKRRGVLTVWPWSVEILEQWVTEVWPHVRPSGSPVLWPSERDARVSDKRFGAAFARIREHAAHLTALTTTGRAHHIGIGSTTPSPWLFPGHLPGRPITANQLGQRLAVFGIDARAARRAAQLQLAAEVPAVVLAEMLGITINTAVDWVHAAGGDWANYAAHTTTNTDPP